MVFLISGNSLVQELPDFLVRNNDVPCFTFLYDPCPHQIAGARCSGCCQPKTVSNLFY